MNRIIRIALVAAAILLPAFGARAASVGASFLGRSGDKAARTLAPEESAGFIPQANWGNVNEEAQNLKGISVSLPDDAGNPTGVQVVFNANDGWSSDGGVETPDEKLFKGFIKCSKSTSMTLAFTNLLAGTYDLYVYGDVNNGPADLNVSLGTTTNYWTEPATFDGTYVDATGGTLGARNVGNYVKFTGVSPVNNALSLVVQHVIGANGGSDGAGIAGLQIVTSSPLPPNTVGVAITTQPKPATGYVGKKVTFIASASGPFAKYQWYKNNAPISGATSPKYTTADLTLDDNLSKFKVTVSNNVNSVTSSEAALTVTELGNVSSVGASFIGRNAADTTLLPDDSAGAPEVAQTNWYNINEGPVNFKGVTPQLTDDEGHPTAVQVVFSSNDSWNSGGSTDTADDRLFKGIIKQNGAVPITLAFTNLAFGTYDVYVYGAVNNGPVDLNVWIGTVTNYWIEPGGFEGTYIEATGGTSEARAEGNYVKFTGVSPVNNAITIMGKHISRGDGLGIAGVQLVSAEAIPPNTLPVSFVKQPDPALAKPGTAATLGVLVNGPFAKYQWYEGTTLIAGATASTYTTRVLTEADNGIKFKVVVSNNVNTITTADINVVVQNDPGTRLNSIGIDFLGNNNSARLAPTDEAGVVKQKLWYTTAAGTAGSSPALQDSVANFTAVQFKFAANGAYFSDGPTDSPDAVMMKGILKAEGNSTMTLDFQNLPNAFYDVYVYGVENASSGDADVWIGNDIRYWSQSTAWDATEGFVEVVGGTPDVRATGNYIKFTGVTPVANTITIKAKHAANSDGIGIAGLQLVSSAAFPLNATPVAITTQPASTTVFEGNGTQFTVAHSGPASYYWYKGGVLIPEATQATYSTPSLVVGDSGSKYTVVLSNNVNQVTSEEAVLTVKSDATPRVVLSFSEGSGTSTANAGSVGGIGTFAQQRGYPQFSSNVPEGPFAPANNTASVDFGPIEAGDSGRAIDFGADAFKNPGGLKTFTLSGWLNLRDLTAGSGGNRVAIALVTQGGLGFDLVQQTDGSLWFGVNQWSDANAQTPRSSPGSLTADETAAAANWVFFAATYDGTLTADNVNFYFGKGDTEVALDPICPLTYDRGAIVQSGLFTLGNFSTIDGARNSGDNRRILRGLMDEIQLRGQVLTLEQIKAVQKQPAVILAPASPTVTASVQGSDLVVKWTSPAAFKLQSRTGFGVGTSWADVNPAPSIVADGDLKTIHIPATGAASFYRLISAN